MEKAKSGKRNITIDIIKIVLCFFVVCIHFSVDRNLIALSRIAVPLFFMLSGFFAKSKISKLRSMEFESEQQRQQVVKKFLLKNFLSHLICLLILGGLTGLAELVFNLTNVSHELSYKMFWYLAAQVTVDVVYAFLILKNKEQKAYLLIVPLFAVGLFLGAYSKFLFGSLPLQLHRNFLFVGLPCFMIGDFVATKNKSFSNKQLFAFLLAGFIFFVLQMLEFNLLAGGEKISGDVFVSTIFSCACLLIFAVNFKVSVDNNVFYHIFGRNLTLYIYAFHIVVGNLLFMIFQTRSVFWIFLASLILCYVIDHIVFFLKKKYNLSLTEFVAKKLKKR